MSNDYRKRFIATLLRLLPLASLMIVLAFFFWLQPESSTQAAAPQAAELGIVKSAPTEVASGQEFEYTLQYSCPSITEDCLDVTVTDVLPPELSGDASHVTLVGSPHTTGKSYDEGSRTATWTFVNPLPAGSTGQVKLKVRFPAGTTPNGTSTTNEALINASNAPPVTSNPVSVTATAGSKWFAEKSLLVEMDPALDEEVNYRVRLCQPDDGDIGGLNLNNAQLSDTFPAGATFVSASDGGVHDGANTVTWDLGNLEVDDDDYCVNRYLTVIYPSSTFSIDNIVTNECKGSGTLVGESSPIDPIGPVGVDHGFAEPTTDILFNKSGGSDRYAGQSFSFYFDVENEGNTRVDSFVISDTIDPAFNVYRIRSGYYSVPLSLTIRYQTNTNPTWVDLLGSPFDSLDNDDVNVSDLGLGDDYITAVQWDFGDAPPGFRDYTQPRIYATLINPDNEGNAVNVGDEKSNCAKLTWDENGTPVELENCEIVTVIEDPNGGANANNPKVDAEKRVETDGPYLPNDTVTYRIMVRNLSSDNPYINPMAMDLLPDELEYVDGSWSLDARSTGAPQPIFEKIDNYNDTGRTLLRWSWTGASAFELDYDYMYIYFDTTVKPGTQAGSVSNSYQEGTNDGPMACYSGSETGTDELDLDGDGDNTETVCQKSTSVTIESVPAMESVKLVKGELDDEWHKFPESGLTVPGGKDDYRLQVSNIGNVPMTNLVIVDILPFVGDTGVIDPQDRLSEWRPNLIGAVNAPAGVTVFYSTESNPCRPELVPAGPAGCAPANWSTVLPADTTTVQSLKFDFGSIVLDPLDSLELEWPMRAPIGAPDGGEIAWNSFGYIADRVDTGTSLLPSEPIKVGVAIQPVEPAAYGDYVWVDDNEDGVQNEAPERGLNGVQVNFYTDNGDNVPDPANDTLYSFTITTDDANGDPGYYQFTNLPVGCYFAEFERPATYAMTSLDQGADDALDSDADPATGLTEVTCLEEGEFDKSWDMGVVPATTATVGNYVWFDRNDDGVQNESTADGINGVTVTLYPEGSDTPIQTTLTASDNSGNPGFYLFDSVDPGNYFICFDLPTDATFSTADAGGDDALDSDVTDTANGCTDVFTLNVGDYDTSRDAGMILPTGSLSLGDTVW
ncbi:MAG: SdrD B-like domain-containing protein, partial [Ardenticatenaceae bacterium]